MGAAEDLALARACLAREPAALDELERGHLAVARRRLERLGYSATVIAEACQLARLSLLFASEGGAPPALAGFTGQGPLGRFIEVVVARAAAGLLRRERPGHEGYEDDAQLVSQLHLADVEHALAHEQQRQLVRAAVHGAIASLTPRERALLRFQLLDGRTQEEIAAVYGVTRITVARWLNELRGKLVASTRSKVGTGDDMDLALSRIDLSLSRLLGDA